MDRARKDRLLVEIGRRLRDHRKRSGFTQEEVAFRAGLNPRFLGCVERGEKHIAVARLLVVLSVVGAAPADFFAKFPEDLIQPVVE